MTNFQTPHIILEQLSGEGEGSPKFRGTSYRPGCPIRLGTGSHKAAEHLLPRAVLAMVVPEAQLILSWALKNGQVPGIECGMVLTDCRR